MKDGDFSRDLVFFSFVSKVVDLYSCTIDGSIGLEMARIPS